MESDLLRGFQAVAEAGSFTEAAERLPISQSGLSQQIRRLERLLGVSLFTRSTRQVHLTELGRRLLPLVDDLLRLEDEILATARRAATGREPTTLRIFVAGGGTGSILVDLIDRLRTITEDVRVEVQQIPISNHAGIFADAPQRSALIERTPTGRAPGPGRRTPLRAEPLCLVVPTDSRVASRMTVAEAAELDLRPMTWLPPDWLEWFPLFAGTTSPSEPDTILVVRSFRTAIQSIPLDRVPCISLRSVAESMIDVECRIIELVDAPVATLDLVTVADATLLDDLHRIAGDISAEVEGGIPIT